MSITFEQGRLSATGTADDMIDTLQLKTSATDFLILFVGWINSAYPEVIPALTSLKGQYILAFLPIPLKCIGREFGFKELFTNMFAPHQLQMLKPDSMIFRHVLQEMNIAPNRYCSITITPPILMPPGSWVLMPWR